MASYSTPPETAQGGFQDSLKGTVIAGRQLQLPGTALACSFRDFFRCRSRGGGGSSVQVNRRVEETKTSVRGTALIDRNLTVMTSE